MYRHHNLLVKLFQLSGSLCARCDICIRREQQHSLHTVQERHPVHVRILVHIELTILILWQTNKIYNDSQLRCTFWSTLNWPYSSNEKNIYISSTRNWHKHFHTFLTLMMKSTFWNENGILAIRYNFIFSFITIGEVKYVFLSFYHWNLNTGPPNPLFNIFKGF